MPSCSGARRCVTSPATFSRPEPLNRQQRTVEEYTRIVEKLVGDIEAGEAFQVVPSQRFEMDTDADPLDVYRMLRVSNPSPYMYFLNFGEYQIVGASPELLVLVEDGQVLTRPLAGTMPRGETPDSRSAGKLSPRRITSTGGSGVPAWRAKAITSRRSPHTSRRC